jgi:hypothetical protein
MASNGMMRGPLQSNRGQILQDDLHGAQSGGLRFKVKDGYGEEAGARDMYAKHNTNGT